ncbi:transcriptional regulator, partial [Rhizobium ruizarguesonis]
RKKRREGKEERGREERRGERRREGKRKKREEKEREGKEKGEEEDRTRNSADSCDDTYSRVALVAAGLGSGFAPEWT